MSEASKTDRIVFALVQSTEDGHRVQIAKVGHHFVLPGLDISTEKAHVGAALLLEALCGASVGANASIHSTLPAPAGQQLAIAQIPAGVELSPVLDITHWRAASIDELDYHLGQEWSATIRALKRVISTL